MSQTVKNLPAMWETQVWTLDLEDTLGKGMATHSNILAWKIPWTDATVHVDNKDSDMNEWLTLSTLSWIKLDKSEKKNLDKSCILKMKVTDEVGIFLYIKLGLKWSKKSANVLSILNHKLTIELYIIYNCFIYKFMY